MDNKKSIFQIDHDLLQEFFNKDTGSNYGGNSFYDEEPEKDSFMRYTGFNQGNYYPQFENVAQPTPALEEGSRNDLVYPGIKTESENNRQGQFSYESTQYKQELLQNQNLSGEGNGNGKGSRRKDKEKTKNVSFKEEVKKSKTKVDKNPPKKQLSNDSLMDDDDLDDYDSSSDQSNYNMGSSKKSGETQDGKKKQRRQRGGASTDSRQRRLEKNRESARESRKRKKNYITTLEAKNQTLESEVNRLRLILQNQKEKEKLSYFSHLDSMDQLLTGRQTLYERLENCVNSGGDGPEMENIINALQIRTGSFGVERKNLVNNLFKTIIEVSFPNFVKYLFWGSTQNKGLFDDDGIIDAEKRKKLSKYQLEELKARIGFDIIDTLLDQKKALFKESSKMEQCMGRLRSYLTTEQTAKFLILMEKFKSKQELSLFRLWDIKKLDKSRDKQMIKMYSVNGKDSDDEGGLPESDEELMNLQKAAAMQGVNMHGQAILNATQFQAGSSIINKKTDMLLN
ncbi:UNKNOWN [Stylonychia lemnae]|uniref:BZIP domain-containing protein n=1 Tax=Stylonychia lemnae TaxID=5949 RepID=A0A078ADC3_STYLE|nr:UNKNOWN [Stylonychia lemnae]|eukprot:CDW80244.1 UNKNOWN [Stylonychia lemnae]